MNNVCRQWVAIWIQLCMNPKISCFFYKVIRGTKIEALPRYTTPGGNIKGMTFPRQVPYTGEVWVLWSSGQCCVGKCNYQLSRGSIRDSWFAASANYWDVHNQPSWAQGCWLHYHNLETGHPVQGWKRSRPKGGVETKRPSLLCSLPCNKAVT